MVDDLTRSPRLGQALMLRSGVCVRLRLAHFSDIPAIAELIQQHAAPTIDLTAERLVQFDPRRRYVVCAMALIEGSERLVGVGAIDLAPVLVPPDVLIFDPSIGEQLPQVLDGALRGVAEANARARAA